MEMNGNTIILPPCYSNKLIPPKFLGLRCEIVNEEYYYPKSYLAGGYSIAGHLFVNYPCDNLWLNVLPYRPSVINTTIKQRFNGWKR